MAKINVGKKITTLDGKPTSFNGQEMTIGKTIGYVLTLAKRSPDPLRSNVLARKLYDATGTIELDKSDISFIKDQVVADETFLIGARGQILEALEEK